VFLIGLLAAAPARAQQPPISVTLDAAVVAPLSGSANGPSRTPAPRSAARWEISPTAASIPSSAAAAGRGRNTSKPCTKRSRHDEREHEETEAAQDSWKRQLLV
jgi:hypothetical protein